MIKEPLMGHISNCQICENENLELILSLGHQPPVHAHLTQEKMREPEIFYPLNLKKCKECGLAQIDYAVDPNILFPPDYPYQTGMTNMLVENFRSLASKVIDSYNLKDDDLVVDIGSNDGTLLQGFKDRGLRVLGVEPTNVADLANSRGMPTIREFFSLSTSRRIVSERGLAKVVTATNMFAHINNLFEFLKGVDNILDEDGVFISESQYLMDVIEKLEVDTIYHEHLRYYSLKPLLRLFRDFGFTLVDAERIGAAGGSIRAYAMRGDRQTSQRVFELIKAEERAGLYDGELLSRFAQKAREAKRELLSILIDLKRQGRRIVGIGAPGRSNTLLGFKKVDEHFLDYAVERSGSPKIGLFAPGSHIPIVDEEILFSDQPEYGLLLSWHIGDELMRKLRGRGYKGKFIMPLPEPRIMEDI